MADERRNIDTDTKKDAEEQKQGTGIQAATDKRDESIVAREEGGAVEHKTPGPGSRRGDKYDLPLTGDPLHPAPKEVTITLGTDGSIKSKVGKEERTGGRVFADVDMTTLLALTNAVRAETGSR